ncbi:hypothetical protein QF015_003497 [Paenarthrobacter sp. TE4293]
MRLIVVVGGVVGLRPVLGPRRRRGRRAAAGVGAAAEAGAILCALGRSSLGRALPDVPRLLWTLSHLSRVCGGCSLTFRRFWRDALSPSGRLSGMLSHLSPVLAGRSLTFRPFWRDALSPFAGVSEWSTAVVGFGGWCFGCGVVGGVMGFTGGCCGGFGVVWWVWGLVLLVFAGFLGGVGVDLVWGWGACKVIRVAAADAES